MCIMLPWLCSVYMDAVMEELKMGMGRRGEGRLPDLLYTDDLVPDCESEGDLRAMVESY